MNDSVNDVIDASRTAPGPALLSHSLPRELLLLVLCLALGVLVMPCIIFAAGRLSLGPYEHGGVFALWRDFLAGLGHGSEAFWFVALCPYILLCVLRLLLRLLHN